MDENFNEEKLTKDNVDYIKKAKEYVNEILKEKEEQNLTEIEYYNRIYKTCLEICEEEKESDAFITLISSLLFDVDNIELFPDNNDNNNLKAFLHEINLDDEIKEKIINLINEISNLKNEEIKPNSLEGKIIEDAINIDNLSAVGICRIFSKNNLIYDENEEEEIEDHENNISSIKILTNFVINVKNILNTEKGKEIANKKIEFSLLFLKNFYSEMNNKNKLKLIEDLEKDVLKDKVKFYSKKAKKELIDIIEKEKEKDNLREYLKNELETQFERDNLERIYQRERAQTEKKINKKQKEIDFKIREYEEKLKRKFKINNEIE